MKQLLGIFLLFSSFPAICQEKFNVELHYEKSKSDTIYVTVDNGIEEKEYFLSDSPLLIEDYYTSEFVSIQLYHARNDGNPPSYELGFFTNAEKSNATVGVESSGKPYLIKRKNLFLFEEMGSEKLNEFTKKAYDSFWNFYYENVSQFGRNDSITAAAFALNKAHNLKVTEAIQQLESSYYSFWLFRKQIANNPDVDREVKEKILLTKFKSFEDTYEYNLAKDLIFGAQIKLGEKINDFESVDIVTNKEISLSSLEKPLLLMSWATWCAPCIKKMDILKDVALKYPEMDVLFVNKDTNMEKAKNLIAKRRIGGNHFSYLNGGIPTLFSDQLIPKIYLIDKDATVIYNYDLGPDADLKILNETLAKYFNQ